VPATTEPVVIAPPGRVPVTTETEAAAVVGLVAADDAGRVAVEAAREPVAAVGAVVGATNEPVITEPAGFVAAVAAVASAGVGVAVIGTVMEAVVGAAAVSVSVAVLPPQAVRSAANMSSAITGNAKRRCIRPSLPFLVWLLCHIPVRARSACTNACA